MEKGLPLVASYQALHHEEQDWKLLELEANSDLEGGFVVLVGDLQKTQDWKGQI